MITFQLCFWLLFIMYR